MDCVLSCTRCSLVRDAAQKLGKLLEEGRFKAERKDNCFKEKHPAAICDP